jgi:hypothetical protein
MVIVPRDLPGRTTTLSDALAGTTIRVLVDRRETERRRSPELAVPERRQHDRRTTPRIVAYVHACPVVAVGSSSAVGAAAH